MSRFLTREGMPHSSKGGDDPTDAMASGGKVVLITHIPSGKMVGFKAFIKDFRDSYAVDWSSQRVYGRMDPIMNFQGTSRNMTISFSVPAASAYDSYKNLQRLSQLIRMCYPTYTNAAGTGNRVLKAAPLWRIKFMNWARDSVNPNKGLVGTIQSIDFSPDMKEGVFDGDDGTIADIPLGDVLGGFASNFGDETPFGTPSIYPKSFDIYLSFAVLHTHPLGFSDEWSELPEGTDKSQGNPQPYNDGPGDAFPYAIDKPPPPPPSARRSSLGPGDEVAAAESEGILSSWGSSISEGVDWISSQGTDVDGEGNKP